MDVKIKMDAISFGAVAINGKNYTSDLIIYPDGRVEDNWWRRKGHSLALEDIHDLVSSDPGVIVVGTGANGLMEPVSGLKGALQEKGIELIAIPNQKAMEIFNELASKQRVGACFHLTC